MVALVMCGVTLVQADNPKDITIVSPYSNVNWTTYGQFKAALHVHTSNSDGRRPLAQVIEEHYEKDYDIVAATDHNFLTTTWVATTNGPTEKRVAEIKKGVDRKGRGMIEIPYSIEQSYRHHLNTFLANYPSHSHNAGDPWESTLTAVGNLGGLSRLNHPGRYTGGRVEGEEGEAASNNPKNIAKYVKIFMDHPSCVGMEIINRRDGDTFSDRILWDNILKETVPQGRYVWGFSDDDSHSTGAVGHSYNIFVMPSNTVDNFAAAMKSGNFYAVAKIARREQEGIKIDDKLPAPSITSITVNTGAASITINAKDADKIDWISNGAVIASGKTVNLATTEGVGSYVRANISGRGGIVFTQPFGVVRK